MTTVLAIALGMNLEGVSRQIALPIWVIVLGLRFTFVPSFLVMFFTGFERMCIIGPFSEKSKPAPQ